MVKLVTPIVSPSVQIMPPAKFKSAPETTTVPCAMTVVPAEDVQMRQYPAVPALPVAAAVIALMVSTPAEAEPIGFDIVSVASNVPLAAVPQLAGGAPV